MDEILEDLGIDDPIDFREAVLSRCRDLHQAAYANDKLHNFNTPYEFILCDSSEYYQTFVNMG